MTEKYFRIYFLGKHFVFLPLFPIMKAAQVKVRYIWEETACVFSQNRRLRNADFLASLGYIVSLRHACAFQLVSLRPGCNIMRTSLTLKKKGVNGNEEVLHLKII